MEKIYTVNLSGCDDYTEVHIKLDDKGFETIKFLTTLVAQVAKRGCQPTITIQEFNNNQQTV